MITVIKISFREAINKKVFLLIGIFTVIYLAGYAIFIYFIMKDLDGGRIDNYSGFLAGASFISFVGYYFSSMLLAFLTIMLSAGAVSHDMESGIIQSTISKPLSRRSYILGKYLGLVLIISAYSIILFLSVTLISVMFKIPSLSGLKWDIILKSLLLFVLEPLAILSLSIFGSVFFKTLSNGIFLIAVYITGLAGGMIEQIGGTIGNDTLVLCGIASSMISPFDTVYRKMIATLFSNIGIANPMFGIYGIQGAVPSMWMMAYVIFYSTLLLYLAVRKFRKKDL